ncbi:MAG: hypothetical protein MUP66_03910 [Candidatus Nanohaloarchaeota archaeon QJJ-5]|nr:hypothetical protein [Candidatus Nanohaloarchaeota archaeon QJJ-5]
MLVEDTAQQIEALEIQGATRVAIESIKALEDIADDVDDQTLQENADRLLETRPTEPALQNAVRFVLETGRFDEALKHFEEAKTAINSYGAELLADDDAVYTHCHSSTVEGIIIEATEHTDIHVYNTETRPRFQGRITAEELSDAGISVDHFVDSAAIKALDGADRMLIGADAVTADGTVYNKIGSRLIAEAAVRRDVPVHVCTDSWKLWQKEAPVAVEERSHDEVWDSPPTNVSIHNPAFEAVPADLIDSIVTELGVLEPDAVADAYHHHYDH